MEEPLRNSPRFIKTANGRVSVPFKFARILQADLTSSNYIAGRFELFEFYGNSVNFLFY